MIDKDLDQGYWYTREHLDKATRSSFYFGTGAGLIAAAIIGVTGSLLGIW